MELPTVRPVGRPPADLTHHPPFGRLRAVRLLPNAGPNNGGRLWECSCKCGGSKVVAAGDLLSGKVRSCGCLLRDNAGRMHRPYRDRDRRLLKAWGQRLPVLELARRFHLSRQRVYAILHRELGDRWKEVRKSRAG
jgi:hypothetical protein